MQIPFAAPASGLPGTVPLGDRTVATSAATASFAQLFDQSATVSTPIFPAPELLSDLEDCPANPEGLVAEDHQDSAEIAVPTETVDIATLPLPGTADDVSVEVAPRRSTAEARVADDSPVTPGDPAMTPPARSLTVPAHEPRGRPFLQAMAAGQSEPPPATSLALMPPFPGIVPQVLRSRLAEVVQMPVVPTPTAAPGEELHAAATRGAVAGGLMIARNPIDAGTAATEHRAIAQLPIAGTKVTPDSVDMASDVSSKTANPGAAAETATVIPAQGNALKSAVPPFANPSVASAQRAQVQRPEQVFDAATPAPQSVASSPDRTKARSVVADMPPSRAVADSPSGVALVTTRSTASREAVVLGTREGPALPPGLSDGLQTAFGTGQIGQARDPVLAAVLHSDAGPQRPQTPLLAQHVAQQLAVTLRQPADRVTEMSLDPVELGKVRMTVRAQEQAIVMTVIADRPETADLMRRHVDVLQQEFRALGYTTVTLDFSAGQGQSPFDRADRRGDGQSNGATAGDPALATEAADHAPDVTARKADGSLDLRL